MAYDVIIVGGGITGAGTARDCAMRGLKTLLLEKGKPGMATTISSTHLIHGGLRYLLYDRLTTHTTCWDSGHIIRIAAPLLTRLPILWPVYADHTHGIETVETLIEVYDRFSKMKGGLPHLRLTAEETLKLVPSLKREGLVGAVSFDEWWVDPAALVEANLDSARRHGAEILIGAGVDSLIKEGSSAVRGVRCGGQAIEAKLVINAAGPWVDKVARMAGASIALRLQKGTHLGYKERLVPVGLLLEAVDRGRYVFVVPSPQGTLVGPTDLSAGADPDSVKTTPDEVSYLQSSVRRYLSDFPERHDFTTIGARPILGQAGNEKLLSREYEVFDHRKRDGIDGLLTIGGGKMSDFRVMGQAVVDAACARLGVQKRCATHLETLAGEALAPAQEPPQPSRLMKRFLRQHPRAREAHAMAYLAGAFARHLARRAFQTAQAPAAQLKRHYGLIGLLLLCLGAARPARAISLKDGWRLQSSCQGALTGDQISSPRFSPEGWHKTSVPSTVLAALVADKTYPDPYAGMNLRSIPGMDYPPGENFSNLPMASTSPFACSWWYRKEFTLSHAKGRRQWLRLDGINYRANLWLNGIKIGDAAGIAGTWRRYELDVTTAVVSGRNALAVEVFAPQENDLAITWVDWAPAPPDKDMGLFGPVSLEETGPVAIRRPAVFSELSDDLSAAKLTVQATLVNHADKAVQGTLSASFDKRALSQEVTLAPGESRVVSLTPERFAQLSLRKPRLWWPYQMGKPNLYSMRLAFKLGQSVSDSKTVGFGVRRVETEEAPESKAALFKVNGRRVLIRGGGWASDLLLRQSKKRLRDELAYVQQLNLNAVRLEGKLETDDFFDEADRRGILVMPGWCCCDAWERWKDWKDEQYAIAPASLEDQVARLRGHPSVFVWLNGSDNAPPKEVEQAYLDVLRRLSWPNPVLPSAGDQGGIAGHSGVKMEGPYDYVPPDYWLSDTKHGGAFGFDTEVSPGPAIPALESLKRFLGADHLWPADSVWTYHAGGTSFAQTKNFDDALEKRYGKPKDLADYVHKSQAAAYEGQRAMFEAFARNKYRATGVIQWMLNNAWPSTIWHLYDYFLVPGGGFYGTRAACEPLHAQYSYDDRSVVVVSNLAKPVKDVRIEAKIFDLNARARWAYAKDMDLPPDASTRAFVLPQLSGLTTSYFLRLSLIDTDGKPLSDNTYWLSTSPDALDEGKSNWFLTPQSSFADFTGLQNLPPAKLSVSGRMRTKDGKPEAKIVLRNVGRSVAFMTRLRLTRRSDGQEIAPTFWSDNYVTLLPGESKTMTASYDKEDTGGAPGLSIDAWNLPSAAYALTH